jgi:hypothetical protein
MQMVYGVSIFYCINCREPMNEVENDEADCRPPEDGDLLSCPRCFAVMIRDGGRYRLPTDAELARAKRNPDMAPLFALLARKRLQ